MKIKALLDEMNKAKDRVKQYEKWLYLRKGLLFVFSNDNDTRIYLYAQPKKEWLLFTKTVRISAFNSDFEKIEEMVQQASERFGFSAKMRSRKTHHDICEITFDFQFKTRLEDDVEWFNEQYRQANDHIGRIYHIVRDHSEDVSTYIMNCGIHFPFIGEYFADTYTNYAEMLYEQYGKV